MTGLIIYGLDEVRKEAQEMVRLGLYTSDEANRMVMQQEPFITKVNSAVKRLQDYKDYIKCLEDILEEIERRCKEINGDTAFCIGAKHISNQIYRRMQDLYEMVIDRFPDFHTTSQYFDFIRKSQGTINADTMAKMMQKFQSNPCMFWLVANWYQEKENIDEALRVLDIGLMTNKKDPYLYRKAVKLELNEGKQRKEKIQGYICKIVKWMNEDYKFLIKILELLEPHPFTLQYQYMITNVLEVKHFGLVMVWHTLAQRVYKGFPRSLSKIDSESAARTPRIELCCQCYVEGLKKVNNNDELITLYLDWLNGVDEPNKNVYLKVAFEHITKEYKLPEERFYIIWAEIVRTEEVMQDAWNKAVKAQKYGEHQRTEFETRFKDDALRDSLHILEKGTKVFTECTDLWKILFQCAVDLDDEDRTKEIFENATERNPNAPNVWEIYIMYLQLIGDDSNLEKAYRKAINQDAVLITLGPQFVEWLYLNKSLKDARDQYNRIKNKEPYSKELHRTMLQIERSQILIDYQWVGGIQELYCEQFGKHEYEAWISRIEMLCQMCSTHKGELQHIKAKIQNVRKQAEKNLAMVCQDIFKLKLEKLKEKYPMYIV